MPDNCVLPVRYNRVSVLRLDNKLCHSCLALLSSLLPLAQAHAPPPLCSFTFSGCARVHSRTCPPCAGERDARQLQGPSVDEGRDGEPCAALLAARAGDGGLRRRVGGGAAAQRAAGARAAARRRDALQAARRPRHHALRLLRLGQARIRSVSR
eukprot:3731631-Pleurochrysis_carterae.AAC.4